MLESLCGGNQNDVLVTLIIESPGRGNQNGALVTLCTKNPLMKESKSGFDSSFYKKGLFKGFTLENFPKVRK